VLLAAGVSWLAGPVQAANFDVANDAELRSAIGHAGNGDTITFTGNVTLGSNLPTVQRNVTINGGNFTLSGANQYRGLFLETGAVAINNLTIAHTLAQGGHGGNGYGGGGGGAGLGGALFVASGAHATVNNVNFENNQARGGNGGNLMSTGETGPGGGGGYWPNGADGGDGATHHFGVGAGGQGGGGSGGNGTTPVGNGGFGGGGGSSDFTLGGNGGFGGGGGGNGATWALGGLLGGDSGIGSRGGSAGGGGGGGAGGAIFVQDGGTLTFAGALRIFGNAAQGGRGGQGGEMFEPEPGAAAGTGLFLYGNGSLILTPGAGETQVISDNIDDVNGIKNRYTGDFGSGSWSLVKNGAGALTLGGSSTYSGGTTVNDGILLFSSDANLGAAGTGISLNNGTIGIASANGQAINRPVTITGLGAIYVGHNASDPNALVSWTGPIGGAGMLVVDGGGTLALAGANTYSGGTRVTGATLQVTSNASLGAAGTGLTLDGSILRTAPGTPGMTIDRRLSLLGHSGIVVTGDPLIWIGDIAGAGSLIKDGPGKLALTGSSSIGGGTTISGGDLAVNGHLSSNVTVNPSGTLSGAGNVTGDVTNNGGTVKPGNSIGHLTVNGNFTLNSGTLEVEVNDQGDSDRISVIGTGHRVMINAGTLLIAPEAGIYTPGTRYTIVTTEAGGNVTFGDVAGGVGFLTPQVSIDPQHIYVTLALQPGAFRSAGLTINQQAVGGALDAIAASGDVGGLVTAMANVPVAEGAAALQTLSGEPYADFGTVNLRASQLFMNAVGGQMAVARGAGGPAGDNRRTLTEPGTEAASPFSVWGSGIGTRGSIAGNANAADLDYALGGMAVGIDYRLDPRVLLGVAGGYVGGSQSVRGFAGDADTETVSAVAYGSFTEGAFYADALAGYARASNSLQRIIASPGLPAGVADGDTDADQFLGQIETGYKIGLDTPFKTSITPFGRLQVASIGQDGFTENGVSDYNLTVASEATTSVRTTLGADFAASFAIGAGTRLDLGLRLGWVHEFADTDQSMTAAFVAAPGQLFTVSGATAQRDSALVGLSLAAALNEQASLFASYDAELGGGNGNHQLRGGLRLTW
jgi:outer membrane autotransporter protein